MPRVPHLRAPVSGGADVPTPNNEALFGGPGGREGNLSLRALTLSPSVISLYLRVSVVHFFSLPILSKKTFFQGGFERRVFE